MDAWRRWPRALAWPTGCGCSGHARMPNFRRCTVRRMPWFSPRTGKAGPTCCWRRWRVERRSWPATSGAILKSFSDPKPACWHQRTRPTELRQPSEACLRECLRVVPRACTRRDLVGTPRPWGRLHCSGRCPAGDVGAAGLQSRGLTRDRPLRQAPRQHLGTVGASGQPPEQHDHRTVGDGPDCNGESELFADDQRRTRQRVQPRPCQISTPAIAAVASIGRQMPRKRSATLT